MARAKKVDTATLIRGDKYIHRFPPVKGEEPKQSIVFEYDVAQVIDDPKVLEELENEYDEVADGEGEIYDKPRFYIERGVDAPDDPLAKRKRLRSDRDVKTRHGTRSRKRRRAA